MEIEYYMKTGMCKFGASCKYYHPRQSGGSSMPMALNICGYPLRPGEKECSHYLKTGQCKFGVTCKFHHPQPSGVQVAVPGHAPVILAASASTQPNVSSFPAPSGSIPMSDYFADLPEEVLSDILIRLPLKSIGRSRCVSKPWLSILISYEFIKTHLSSQTHLAQEQKLLLFSEGSRLFSLNLHLGGNHLRELEFFDEQVYTVVGSCNGLVLVAAIGSNMWLINCLTKECVKLPDSPFPLCEHFTFDKYGFGYDEISDDYKFVKMSQYGQFGKGIPNCPDIFVDIYSLKMRSWKRLETPLCGHDLLHHDDCVLINGALHWIGLKFTFSRKQSAVIGAFDLSDEKFKEFPAPASVNDGLNYLRVKLMVIDGCLGIVVRPYDAQETEIWLMKSYSLVDSWTNIDVDFKPLCFHQEKILFSGRWPQDLKWYYVKDGRVEVCLAADNKRGFSAGITYSESLVSPHFNYHN